MANKRIKKKRAYNAHQRELREMYSKARKNAVARMRTAESKGYVFNYQFKELTKDFNPHMKDIERLNRLYDEKLYETGMRISSEGEVLSEVSSTGAKVAKAAGEPIKEKPKCKRAAQKIPPEPIQYPVRISTSEGATLEPEEPEDEDLDEEEEPEYFPRPSRADHPPVWNDYVLMRAIGMGARYAQYASPDYQNVAARGQALVNTLRDAINKFGSDRVAQVLYDLMQETGDLFEEKVFYDGKAFAASMEKLYNAFAEVGFVDEETRQREVKKWEDAQEQLQNHEDYDK